MDVFDKFFQRYSYKFDKGYPNMDDPKDVLIIENSNAGFDNNTDQIKSGNGNGSAMYAGARQFKVQPSADNTQIFRVNDKDGNTLLNVDSNSDIVLASGNYVNTQYAHFGISSANSSNYVANTHYPIPFHIGMAVGDSDVDFGTGTDPSTSFTTADTDTQYAGQIVPMMWRVP